jgi:Putative zinc-finger
MLCLRTRRLISAFIDRELDPATASRLSAHLSWCRWCRREAQRVGQGAHLAREARIEAISPPKNSKLAAIMALESKPAGVPGSPSHFFTLVIVTALPIAAVATLVYLQGNSSWLFHKTAAAYALDFGLHPQDSQGDLLSEFRRRYSGKFREFPVKGKPDPSWVPFKFKFPSELPSGMHLKSVMIFDPRFCGSLGLVFTDGTRNLCLVQQPADRPILFSGLKTTTDEFCKYNATHCRVGEYSMVAWTAETIRSVVLSNLDRGQIEATIASLR